MNQIYTTTPPESNPYVVDKKWHDTQLWELVNYDPAHPLRPAVDPKKDCCPNAEAELATFQIPFTVTINSTDNKAKGLASGYQPYQVKRSTFFKPCPEFKRITENHNQYFELADAGICPQAGTYERWYVANIGNQQPEADLADDIPDMHPFHVHLVNFVVTNRYQLSDVTDPAILAQLNIPAGKQGPQQFTPMPANANTYFDGKIRHDTVRIQPNELVELLVYFPEGFSGQYPYHCHLVEHEDMGMMLHFELKE